MQLAFCKYYIKIKIGYISPNLSKFSLHKSKNDIYRRTNSWINQKFQEILINKMETSESRDYENLNSIEISAPSKVLITGCYLIIEPYYSGLVLSCSARLKTTLKISREGEIKTGETVVKCHSPQMGDKTWVFSLKNIYQDDHTTFSVGLDEEQTDDSFEFSRAILNTFFSLLPFSQTLPHESLEQFSKFLDTVSELDFTFIGDNSLYSFEPESSKEQDKDKPLAKTGMGSSATFITSFIATLYCLASKKQALSEEELKEVHILAQIANSVCAKKIGSGFDIAAATYGHLVFKRYNTKEDLPQIIEGIDAIIENNSGESIEANFKNFSENFSFVPVRFEIPKYFNLCMVCTSSGSDTRVMVKNLMQWSREHPDPEHENKDTIFSNENWQNLFKFNLEIIEIFKELKELESTDGYKDQVERFLNKESLDTDVIPSHVSKLTELNNTMRKHLCIITEESGVQVEPARVTKILDNFRDRIPNLVMCGVPGAGGDDAVYILYLSTSEDSKVDREVIKKEINKVNEELETNCGVLPIELNHSEALRIQME
ncbi:unnamed protein product [Moneuplotes crassus]|uniref:phosphomevalonate kinase n=1 Tax=Euplotes crassus TaxID=5936 RepID=A0AAD1X595_EUPCR|nr:unnamed protein product [Moneuplotes crassus]